jgi:hypothetical protein
MAILKNFIDYAAGKEKTKEKACGEIRAAALGA